MGLGKTLQMISLIALDKEQGNNMTRNQISLRLGKLSVLTATLVILPLPCE